MGQPLHDGCMELTIRPATMEDLPALREVMDAAISLLQKGFLTDEQIESSRTIMGLDTQLVEDGTYYVVEAEGRIVAAGGWSARAQLYGPSREEGGGPRLDPATGAARIRAFFTDPSHARRGLARRILERCESEARDSGFHSMELMATLPGRRLYETCGYRAEAPIQYPLRPGLTIEFVPMRKDVL